MGLLPIGDLQNRFESWPCHNTNLFEKFISQLDQEHTQRPLISNVLFACFIDRRLCSHEFRYFKKGNHLFKTKYNEFVPEFKSI